MNTFDWTVLALFATAIGAMLTFSKTARLVFVRSLLHPLTPGYIVTGEDGRVEFVEKPPADEGDEDAEAYGQESPQATEPSERSNPTAASSGVSSAGATGSNAGQAGHRTPARPAPQAKTPERQAR